MKREWIRPLFLVAAAYDTLIGLAFLLAFKPIYAAFGVPPPNHDAYALFCAALVTIFGFAFWLVARDPDRNRDIIKLGILLKFSYASIVLGYHFRHEMPSMWVPFAYADLLFMAAFIAALRVLPPGRVGVKGVRG